MSETTYRVLILLSGRWIEVRKNLTRSDALQAVHDNASHGYTARMEQE